MIKKTLVIVCGTQQLKNVCKLCGKTVLGSTRFDYDNVDYHLAGHFKGITVQAMNGCYIRINYQQTYSVVYVVNIIPQLLYITPIDAPNFIGLISKVIQYAEREILSIGYNLYGSLSAVFAEYKLSEYKSQIMDIINATQFKCSMAANDGEIICGQIYECGLPTIDLVIQHLSSHYANTFFGTKFESSAIQ